MNRGAFNRDSSMSSSEQEELTFEEKGLLEYAKVMLQGKIFVGTFLEQRLVSSLNAYKTIISVSRNERDLIKDLEAVHNRLKRYTNKWFGYTGPNVIGAPAGHCIWTDLSQDVYGTYWYKIKGVKFKRQEILIRIKVIRPIDESEMATPQTTTSQTNEPRPDVNLSEYFETFRESLKTQLIYFFDNILTAKNVKDAFIYVSVLLMTIFTGSVQLIQYLGDFTLRLLRETSNFIRSVTPVLIACINVVGKTIGGLYLLIAMMWRDRKGPTTVYNQRTARPSITWPQQGNSYQYTPHNRYRNSLIITEIRE